MTISDENKISSESKVILVKRASPNSDPENEAILFQELRNWQELQAILRLVNLLRQVSGLKVPTLERENRGTCRVCEKHRDRKSNFLQQAFYKAAVQHFENLSMPCYRQIPAYL